MEITEKKDLEQILGALENRGDHLNSDPDWAALYLRVRTAVEELTRIEKLLLLRLQLGRKRWVCQVVRSGYNNGAGCTHNDPHGGDWGCGVRHEASLTEAQYQQLFGEG